MNLEHRPAAPPPTPRQSASPRLPQEFYAHEKELWRGFFNLAGGSLLYCLSAMSIIYGISKIMGPLLAQASMLREAYPCIGALNIYEVCLLAVLVFTVVRAKVTDDAVSLVVLVALFLIGSGTSLSTVSNSGPQASLFIGVGCLGLGLGKLYVFRRYIGILISWPIFGSLAAVLAWNFNAGPLLSRISQTTAVTRDHWLIASLPLILGGAGVFLFTEWGRKNPVSGKQTVPPFLHRSATPLMFTAILLAAASAHHYVLGYVFDLRSDLGDYLPLISIGSLVLMQLSLNIRSSIGQLDAGLASVPLAVAVFAVLSQTMLPPPHGALGIPWQLPLLLAMTGIAVLWVAVRTGAVPLLGVSAAYALAVVHTFGFSASNPFDLNWYASGSLLVLGLLVFGILKRNPVACFLAVVAGTIGVSTLDAFLPIVEAYRLSPPGAVMGMAGIGALLTALVFGKQTPQIVAVLGALGVMGLTLDVLGPSPEPLDIGVGLGLLALAAAVRVRLRDWMTVTILLLPLVYRLWLVFTKLTAWRYVVLSFILLFVGAWLTARKGQKSVSQEELGTDSPGAKGNGRTS